MSSSGLAYRWQRKLRAHLALARVSNSPTVASNVLAGAALAGALQPDGRTALLVLAMLLFYTAGMYLNDLWDQELDSRERPERPLPAGLVARSEAVVGVIILFATGIVLLWLVGPAPFLSGLALVGLIVLYDAWHKSNPLSPLVMAANRGLVYVTAYLGFSSGISGQLAVWVALLALYIVGLTYIAKTESGPGLTGYWPATLLFLPAAYLLFQGPGPWELAMLILFASWVAYGVSFVYTRTRRQVGAAVGSLIAGVSLLDALVLAGAGSGVGVVLALAAFALALFLQRYISGT
jgi:hypothetical protein